MSRTPQNHPCCLKGDRVCPAQCCGARYRRQHFKLIDMTSVLALAVQAKLKTDVQLLPEPNLQPVEQLIRSCRAPQPVMESVGAVLATSHAQSFAETSTDCWAEGSGYATGLSHIE